MALFYGRGLVHKGRKKRKDDDCDTDGSDEVGRVGSARLPNGILVDTRVVLDGRFEIGEVDSLRREHFLTGL